jgi:hypothetical protein
MCSGQLAQMFGHFEERGVALLSCPHGDDLAGVFPRPRHGCLPGWRVDRSPAGRPTSGFRAA